MRAARPPPTRPHIGLQPTIKHFSSYVVNDWAEDDAWDSGSDDDAPLKPPVQSKPVPVSKPTNPKRKDSSGSISYSFVQAPSASSYPPNTSPLKENLDLKEPSTSNSGWTVIRSSVEAAGADVESHDPSASANYEPDMVVGDIDSDVQTERRNGVTDLPMSSLKMGPSKASILPDAEKILEDPLHATHRFQIRSTSPILQDGARREARSKASHMRERSLRTNRRHKFIECLSHPDVNIGDLRKLSWSGIPPVLRPIAWPLLLGYLPLPASMRASTLARKRQEYASLVEVTFTKGKDSLDQSIWHQIEIDVPRTRPGVLLWMCGETQKSLERILYVWAIRHPASGYVQGINDLVTPFFQIFLSAYIDCDPEQFDPELLPPTILQAIEADSFWCLSRLLDGIQDNYISAQPGIHRSVRRMAELVARIDPPLAAHLKQENVEFMQFAFRWMNCLLMREISVGNTIRMWDTYLAEGPDAFSQFHLYVCSAFLVKWTDKLREMDFQSIIMFLQSLPTQNWSDHDVELLLSEAFLLNSVWHHAQSHFTDK